MHVIRFGLALCAITGLWAQTVTPNGSLAYACTIEVPAGINGQQPFLSLQYDSAAGNGMCGLGWRLTGLSSIARDSRQHVNFDDDDAYTLDGEPLTWSAVSRSWHTRTESYRRITAHNIDSRNGQSNWAVSNPDGTIWHYGNSGDSHVNAVGHPGRALIWLLNRIEDTRGNEIRISYNEDANNGISYPSRIVWSANAGITAHHAVWFPYQERSDDLLSYVPSRVLMSKRLATVEVRTGTDSNGYGGNRLRKYQLAYGQVATSNRSVLQHITEYGRDDGARLPSLNFTYKNPAAKSFASAAKESNGRQDPERLLAIDVNGDGFTDIVNVKDDFTATLISNGDGKFTTSYANKTFDINYKKRDGGVMAGDVNGDGLGDLIQWHREGRLVACYGRTTGQLSNPVVTVTDNLDSTTDFVRAGDLDGDGRTDLAILKRSGRIVTFFARNGTGGFAAGRTFYRDDYVDGQGGLADVDGDGCSDVVWVSTNGRIRVSRNAGNGTFGSTELTTITGNFDEEGQAMWSDVTGDGAMDLLYVEKNGDAKVFVSKGDGTFEAQRKFSIGGMNFVKDGGVQTGDVNGDGLADVIVHRDNGRVVVYPSMGNGTFGNSTTTQLNGWDHEQDRVAMGDVDGNGCIDMLVMRNANNHIYCHLNQTDGAAGTMMALTTGAGATFTVDYETAPKHDGAVVTMSSFPVIANRSPRKLVTKVTTQAGAGQVYRTTYAYQDGRIRSGAVADRVGLGFASITKTDLDSGVRYITRYASEWRLAGKAVSEETRDKLNRLFARTNYTYDVSPVGNWGDGIQRVSLAREEHAMFDGDTVADTTRIDYDYDAEGNLTKAFHHGLISISGDESTVTTTFADHPQNRVRNRPAKVITSGTGEDPGVQRQTFYFYDNLPLGQVSLGELSQERLYTDGDSYVMIKHQYDQWGNRIASTDGNSKRSYNDIDNTFRNRVVSLTDAIGLTTKTTFDAFNLVSVRTLVNGASTQHQYDTLNRLTRSAVTPDNLATPTYTKHYDLDGNFPESVTETKRLDSNTTQTTVSYFDGLGRVVQTKTSAPGGQWITTDRLHDASGGVLWESLPYFTGSPVYSAPKSDQPRLRNEFDALQRVSKAIAADGSVTTYERNGRSLLVTGPDGNAIRTVFDGQGKAVSIEERIGKYGAYATTRYKYRNGSGDLVRIVDAQNNVTRFQFDWLGRKVMIDDPDTGVTRFTYDNNGNILSKTDSRNRKIVYSYDANGRLTKTDYPSVGNTVHHYDLAARNAEGKVWKSTFADGSEELWYDPRGRVSKRTITIKGRSKSFSFAYDSQDNVVALTMPTGEVVRQDYDVSGNLTKVAGQQIYVQGRAYNALGRLTKQLYGNGRSQYNQYYDEANEVDPVSGRKFSQLLRRVEVTGGIMTVKYAYNSRGLVASRDDAQGNAYNEDYAYDHLGRLTRASSGIYGSRNHAYDSIGNITGAVGQAYQYNGAGPHQATKHGNMLYTYDNAGNVIARQEQGKPATKVVYTYDDDGRMTSTNQGDSYAYFGKRRVLKSEGGRSTYNYGDLYFETYEGQVFKESVSYYLAGSERIAQRKGTQVQYLHSDHLNSTSRITDATGKLVEARWYEPYGETVKVIDGNSTQVARIPFRFGGKEEDGTGLYDFGPRYYDPGLRRFVAADTIIPDLYDPQSLNRYAFCRGNPVHYRDPTGHFFWAPIIVGAIIGGVTDGWRGAFIGALSGAVGGLAGAAVADAVGGGTAGLILGGAASGAASSVVNTAFNGGDLFSNVAMGAVTGSVNSAVTGFTGRAAYTHLVLDFGVTECFANTLATQAFASAAGGAVSGMVQSVISGDDLGRSVGLGALRGAASGGLSAMVNAGLDQVCFTADTLVITSTGSKPIADIQVGDLVQAWDEASDQLGWEPVVHHFVRQAPATVLVTLSDGNTIRTTEEHPFWVDDQISGWTAAGRLEPGMPLRSTASTGLSVRSVEHLPGQIEVHNLEVRNAHTYHVGTAGVLVHNFCTNPRTVRGIVAHLTGMEDNSGSNGLATFVKKSVSFKFGITLSGNERAYGGKVTGQSTSGSYSWGPISGGAKFSLDSPEATFGIKGDLKAVLQSVAALLVEAPPLAAALIQVADALPPEVNIGGGADVNIGRTSAGKVYVRINTYVNGAFNPGAPLNIKGAGEALGRSWQISDPGNLPSGF